MSPILAALPRAGPPSSKFMNTVLYDTYNTPGVYKLPLSLFADVQTEARDNQWLCALGHTAAHEADNRLTSSVSKVYFTTSCVCVLVDDVPP